MISNKKLKTLPIGISMYAQTLPGNKGAQLAVALFATIPVVVLFIGVVVFLRRRIEKVDAVDTAGKGEE